MAGKFRKLRPSPWAITIAASDIYRRLPPAQRRQLMNMARKHGPKLAARAAKATTGRRRRSSPPAAPPPSRPPPIRRDQGEGEGRGRGRLDAQRGADDPVLLAQVRHRVALARAGAPRTTHVDERHVFGSSPPAGDGERATHPCSAALPAPRRPRAGSDSRPRAPSRVRGGTDRAARARDPDARGFRALLVSSDVVVDLPLAEQSLSTLSWSAFGSSITGRNSPPARS